VRLAVALRQCVSVGCSTLRHLTLRYRLLWHVAAPYGMLRYGHVTACCETLLCVTDGYGTLRCVTMSYGGLRCFVLCQCVTPVCYDTPQHVTVRYGTMLHVMVHYGWLRHVAVHYGRYGTLQYVTVRCVTERYATLRHIAECCGELRSVAAPYGAFPVTTALYAL